MLDTEEFKAAPGPESHRTRPTRGRASAAHAVEHHGASSLPSCGDIARGGSLPPHGTDPQRGLSNAPDRVRGRALAITLSVPPRAHPPRGTSGVYRTHAAAGLSGRRHRSRERVAVAREPISLPTVPDEVGPMDFVSDALADESRVKILNIDNGYTRESVNLAVEQA